jgi:hypothetical protein
VQSEKKNTRGEVFSKTSSLHNFSYTLSLSYIDDLES